MNDNQLQQLLQAINTLQDLGKVAYFNKGAYNSETTYEINDVVTYQGSSYVSLGNNNQGNLPTNATYWSVVALKGDKGDTGKPFVIEKTYISIQEMVADYDNMNVNDYVMISGSIEDEQNATLWTKTETPAPTYKWVYLADFSGASGITGQTPNIQIGNVTEGNEPAVTRRQGSTNENPILDFVLKTGATGATGATGNGISQVSKTSTSGLTDTYTIEYTSGNSTTFDVTNGKGITSIAKTSTSGLVDTYTITYNDGTTSTFTITNGEDGEVTQAQLDETNNQVAKANMVYNALPKVSDEGDSLTLDGTANCPMKMELKGNTEQTTYTGKNLSPNSVATTTDSGYLNTSTGWFGYVETGKTYTLSLIIASSNTSTGNTEIRCFTSTTGGTNQGKVEQFNRINGGGTISRTFTSPYTGYLSFSGSGMLSNSDVFTNVQLEEGSTATDYEPYCGGTPSPNPDYPQDVRVVTGNNNVKVVGKNLAYNVSYASRISQYYNLVTTSYSVIKDKYYAISVNTPNTGIRCYINLQTSYKLNRLSSNYVETLDGTRKTWIAQATETAIVTDATIISRYDTTSEVETGLLSNLMIEEIPSSSSTSTPYEPYQSQTYPINLGNIELCKIGSYQDYIYYDNGKWYKHSEIGKAVLDGSESWAKEAESFFCYEYKSNTNYNSPINMNNYFNNTMYSRIVIAYNNLYLRFPKSVGIDVSTIELFKTWLSTHNTIIYYAMTTPTNEEITDTTLISQLNAIENAVSYDTQTNILQENYSEPFIINAECVRSLKDIFELIGNS